MAAATESVSLYRCLFIVTEPCGHHLLMEVARCFIYISGAGCSWPLIINREALVLIRRHREYQILMNGGARVDLGLVRGYVAIVLIFTCGEVRATQVYKSFLFPSPPPPGKKGF